MNIETSEISGHPRLQATPDQSTTHQFRVGEVESTATNPLRQSLDYSHQVFSTKQDKKILPLNQKSQSEAGMGLYIMDIFGRPVPRENAFVNIEEDEKEIEQNKKEENSDLKQSKSGIIELKDIDIEGKKEEQEDNEEPDEIDQLQGGSEKKISLPALDQREPSRPAEQNIREVHEIHEMWVSNPDLESHRVNQAGSDEAAALNRLSSNPETRRHGSRQNSRRLRSQLSNARITVLGQTEDIHYEAWLDFDAIQSQENRELQQRITQAVDGEYYRKLGLFFVEMILFIVCYLITSKVIAVQVLPAVIAIMCAIVAIYAGSRVTREDFSEKEDRWKVLLVFDWLCFVQYALCLTLKLQGDLQSHLYFNTLPGFAIIVLYLSFIELPRANRANIIITRILSWVQLLLLSFQIDDVVDINWNLTFIISWFVCIALVVATVVAFGFLAVNLYLFRHREQPSQPSRTMPFKWQMLTIGINFAMLAVSIFLLIILVSFTKYMDGDLNLLHVLEGAFLAGLVYTLVVFALAIVFRKTLKQFFTDEVSGQPAYKPAPGQRILAFKTEDLKQKPLFFTIISPTYFLLFDQSLLLGEEQSLVKLKSYMSKLKDRVKEAIKSKVMGEKIPIEQLKKEIKPTKSINSEKEGRNNDISLQIPTEKDEQHVCDTEHMKLSLSVDDKEKISSFKTLRNAALNIEEAEEAEQLCFICYERTANSIFMNCGHGGVCFDCAQETWNKKSSCITCRERISEIVKYVPVKGMRMVRAVSRTKRVYEVLRSRAFVQSNL